jgi:DNA-binding LacI/PurR family transcriptional regulator
VSSGFSRITIKDVAIKAEVSVATVSLVMSGSPKIAAKTRRKVLAAAEELGYVPNEYAASLRKTRRDVYAAIIPDLNNPYYIGIIRGLRDRCTKQGIVLHISETLHDFEVEKAELRFLRGVQTSGYVFIGTVLDDELIETLTNCTVVTVDKVYGYVNQYPQVLINNRHCTHQATAYLISKGCRNIWYITPPARTFGLEDRLEGFKDAIREAGLTDHEDHVCVSYDGQMNMMEAGYIQTNLILASTRPDGIIATSDLYAIGAMRAIRDHGLSIPQDVSVVGFDNSEIGRYYQPTLTTFSLPLARMGEMAFDFLRGDLDNKIGKLVVSADFIVRDSVRR